MAKPFASKAPSAKARKGAPDARAAAPPKRATPSKNGAAKPAQWKDKKPATAADAAAAASPEVAALLTRMGDKGLQWFDALKPLKPLEAAAPAALSKRATLKAAAQQAKQPKPVAEETKPHALSEPEVQEKKRHAQRLLEAEVARHESRKSGKMSSDDKYLATMMSKGTLADRVAALTLTIQGAPFHSINRLGQLITMATKKARRESMMAVESLKDLFVTNLLPDDRKLNFFHQNALDHADATDAHLVVWFYEHCLKTAFAQLVGALSAGMQDAVDNHKRACIRAAQALLAAKPEQEAVLLGMLVNKIGDPDRKIAAYIHKTLQDLLKEHPLMKRVVVDEVERLLTRAQVSDRTKYNAVLFLNQVLLRKDDEDDAALAAHLIKVFFALFSKEVHGAEVAEKKRLQKAQHKASKKSGKGAAVGQDGGSMDRKLLSALLAGVNRAFPYSKTATSADLEEEIDTLFKVVRMAKHFPTSVHAMMLLFQVMNATNSVSDRFYTALYEKLFDPKLRETSKHTLFLNLVFKALKADVSPARASAFVKRLLQLTSVMTPAFTCAVLFLLSEVIKIKPQLRTLLDQPEAGGGGGKDDEHFTDKDSDDTPNVFNPDDEEDDEDDEEENDEEENDEAKASDDESSTTDGPGDGLTDAERTAKVLAEMFGSSAAAEPEKPRAAKSFDDEETAAKPKTAEQPAAAAGSSYDCHKRNPLYAGAETSCAWEIHHLLCHYHPSVQMFARQLVANAKAGIQYAGDPLVDFTMHAFFEKFMNKKPRHKQQASAPGHASDAANKSWTFVPMNTEAVLQEAEESIDISDQFFYKFFKERAEREAAHPSKRAAKKAKKPRGGDDLEGDVFSGDEGDEDEDEEVEAFAQQLAEGIMQDGDLDDEDPELDDWSGPEDGGGGGDDDDDDDDDDDGGELDGGDDDDEAMAFGGEDDDDDDESDEDGFDFSAMDGELDLPKAAKQKAPPAASKKKSMFADADDYESIMREALAKQKQQLSAMNKKRKDVVVASGGSSKQAKKPRKH